jgi:PII-like signaling protein
MFRIVITEAVEREGLTAKEWAVIGHEDPTPGATLLKGIFGYTPQETKRETIEVKRLEQTVDILDLASVIKAVNGL